MKFGLIGKTLSHSYSAEIHREIANYKYELLELSESELSGFFKKRDFRGINVTIPYKETVIPYLDEISENAKKIGAVNTVINDNGRLLGYNTDFFGMSALIEHLGLIPNGKKVLILGTGGTSKTAFAVAESLGAKEIVFVSRTKKGGAVTFSEVYKKYSDAQIIINTTPVGMFPNLDGTPVNLENFPHLEGVIDAVYNPLRTNLVLNAQKMGILAVGGLYMLSAQAVLASSLFLGKDTDRDLIDIAYKKVKSGKENIVLIGMPSSGKTTLGNMLSKRLKKDFFDSDDEIVKVIGMPIPKFFQKYGEKKFREIEKGVVETLSKKCGAVIATGGGTILDENNVCALKRNGRLVFLDRPLSLLTPTADRPLSSEKADLEKLYFERYPLYKNAADVAVSADKSPNIILDEILKELV